jgi:hypothetical protein
MYNKTAHFQHKALQRDIGRTESSNYAWFFVLGDVVNWFLVLPLCYLLFRRSATTFFSSPAGFANAPVTKSAMLLTTVFSLWAMLTGRAPDLSLRYWKFGIGTFFVRLATYQLYFSSLWAMMCGCLMMYQFRQFERQWGAGKV